MFCVTPYYTVHMQQLGLTVREIAIIYAFLPISAIIGPIASGEKRRRVDIGCLTES